MIKITSSDGKREIGDKIVQKGQVLHVFNVFLSSLLVNEVSQGGWDIEVLRSLFTNLFVAEIYNLTASLVTNLNVKKLG